MLSHEHEQRRRLEDMVEQLARQHSHLEQAAQQQQHKPQGGGQVLAHSIHSEEDEDNEFFDAEEDEIKADFIVQVPIGHRRTPSGVSTNSQASEGRNAGDNTQDSESDDADTTISVITRRNTSTVVSPN